MVKSKITIFDGAVVLLIAILGNLVMQGLISFVASAFKIGAGIDIISNTYFNLVGMLFIQASFFVAPILYFKVIKKAKPQLLTEFSFNAKKSNFIIAVAISVICIIGFYMPTLWFSALLEKIGYTSSGMVVLDSAGKIILGMFVMVVAAPIMEERIFRGYFLSGIRDSYSEVAAILLSGGAFSLMHMNPEQTVYQFCLGCVCAFAALRTKNLIVPIIIHAVSNLIALLLDLTALGNVFNAALVFMTSTWYFSLIFTVLLTGAGAVALYFIIIKMGKSKTVNVTASPLATAAPQLKSIDKAEQGNNDNIQLENAVNAAIAKKRKLAIKLIIGALAICLAVWISVFIVSMMPPITLKLGGVL